VTGSGTAAAEHSAAGTVEMAFGIEDETRSQRPAAVTESCNFPALAA